MKELSSCGSDSSLVPPPTRLRPSGASHGELVRVSSSWGPAGELFRMHLTTWRNTARRFVVDVVARGKASSPCVVTDPWVDVEVACGTGRALLNPANSQLVGTARAYFPRGGPVPPAPPPGVQASSTGWGGLDAGEQMLYPAQVVDGLTHMHAGRGLREALAAIPARANG